MGCRVGSVGIGRLGLLLCLGVEKMVMAEEEKTLNIFVFHKTREKAMRIENRLLYYGSDSANRTSLNQQI